MAPQLQESDAWTRARNRYVEDLNEEEQRMYFRASPESLLDDASTVQKSHGTGSTARRVMEKLQPFVAAIEQYGNALDVYSNTYPLALAPIWGSVKVLLHIAREFGKYFDKLVEMFARIGDVLPRFKTYERLFSDHERLIQALSIAYLDIITFCINAKAVFRRGQRSSITTLKVAFKLLWKPFDQQFGQQLDAFRQHQENVEKEALSAHMIEAADVRAVVLADKKQLEQRRREDNRLRIIDMLHAVDYEAKHRKLQNLRLAGTGDWLFRQAMFVEWKLSRSSAFLCCQGIPGCGKSILVSNLIDQLFRSASAPAASASNVIYYYCDHADQRTLHLEHILGTLLKQLLLNVQIPEHIETQLLHIYAGGTRSPAENALVEVFYSVVALRPELYVVFDGLDECDKPVWKALLQVLRHLLAFRASNVKIFLTCVEEGWVSHHLADYASIQLSSAATSEDIESFVTASVRSKVESGDLKVRNPDLIRDISSELIAKANGMFLWVYFQLNDLCESSSDAMIRETLENLPEGLGETYRRMLLTIGKSPLKSQLARRVFRWATVAKRPLHVEELKEAVAFDPGDKNWEADKIPHEDIMFESCRGLIVKDGDDGTVRFAHHTVRQYLIGGLITKVDPYFEVSTQDSEMAAAQTCVTYLSFSDFESQIARTTPIASFEPRGILKSGGPLWIPGTLGIRKPMFNIPYRLLRGDPAGRLSNIDYWKQLRPPQPTYSASIYLKDKYRLLCYAVEYWEPHTRLYPTDGWPFAHLSWLDRLARFAKDKILAFEFRPWGPNQHFGPHGCVGCPRPSDGSPVAEDLPHISMIHYAAKVGNLPLLRWHISGEMRIRDYVHHERYHQETLVIACRHNRRNIVEFLLSQEKYDISDGRAANAAAASGSVEALQVLFKFAHYPSVREGHSALALAAKSGHEAVIRVLADAGLNFEAYDAQTRRTINDRMVELQHMDCSEVEQLLSQTHTHALFLAAGNGHVAATRALLECGATASRQFALHTAAESGHYAIVEILLEHGADPFFLIGTGNAFQSAAIGGHVNVLESLDKVYPLLESRYRGSGLSVLHLAAARGHDKALRWLAEKTLHIDDWYIYTETARGSVETPLSLAVKHEQETTVRVLLELGARVIFTHSDDVLVYAVENGDLPVLQMLLDGIRDQRCPNDQKYHCINKALQEARIRGNKRVTELLEQALSRYSDMSDSDGQ